MVYIKVPEDARPGTIIGLSSYNTFTTCAKCGRETPMHEPFFLWKENSNFYLRTYVCMNCYVQSAVDSQMKFLNELFGNENTHSLPYDSEYKECAKENKEDSEDE